LEILMSVYSIWESRFPAEAAEEGLKVTKAIWACESGNGVIEPSRESDLCRS
jgi:hypothetical protein